MSNGVAPNRHGRLTRHAPLRRASTWVFAVMLTVLPLVIMQALSHEPQHLDSPISTATAVALIGGDRHPVHGDVLRRRYALT